MEAVARAVLSGSVTRDDLDDAFVEGGWRLVNVVDALPGRPSQLLFARDAGASYVYVVDDMRLGVTYLVANRPEGAEAMAGPDPASVIAELSEALPCVDAGARHELLGALDGSEAPDRTSGGRAPVPAEDAIRLGLALLVLLEPEAEDAESTLRAALKHPSPGVRAAALTAVTYAPKTTLLPSVLAMQTSDDEPGLREAAARVLESIYTGAA